VVLGCIIKLAEHESGSKPAGSIPPRFLLQVPACVPVLTSLNDELCHGCVSQKKKKPLYSQSYFNYSNGKQTKTPGSLELLLSEVQTGRHKGQSIEILLVWELSATCRIALHSMGTGDF
jgi:hypothetical protein